jgi:hypothetical protein
MNSELKRAIYRKKMLYNKFQKYNNSKNWEAYRRQRNYVTKFKSKSINTYFTISVSGLTIIGFAKWSSLGEVPSIPVAFFTFILLIRFSTKSGFIEEKEKLFSCNSGWLFFISKILGWSPIHKKNSVLVKGNNRPVSVLPAISKMFEMLLKHNQ